MKRLEAIVCSTFPEYFDGSGKLAWQEVLATVVDEVDIDQAGMGASFMRAPQIACPIVLPLHLFPYYRLGGKQAITFPTAATVLHGILDPHVAIYTLGQQGGGGLTGPGI